MNGVQVVCANEGLNAEEPFVRRQLSRRGEPVWELALLSPRQGEWTEADYFAIEAGEFVELVDGCLEFLPMPRPSHQFMMKYLMRLLDEVIPSKYPGYVLPAPCPVRLWPERVREPDLFYLRPERMKDSNQAPDGADLMIEIVSDGAENRHRDIVDKRIDYARAGVREYWIVDPETETITVLALDGEAYRVHGEFKSGDTATSVLLDGFSVPVAAVFAAGQGVSG